MAVSAMRVMGVSPMLCGGRADGETTAETAVTRTAETAVTRTAETAVTRTGETPVSRTGETPVSRTTVTHSGPLHSPSLPAYTARHRSIDHSGDCHAGNDVA